MARLFRFILLIVWLISTITPGLAEAADWKVAAPTSQGFDETRLRALITGIESGAIYPETRGLLIARNGYLVSEIYFSGSDAERLHPMQSVTKSFLSALIGIAVARGEINSVDDPVLDYFPRFAVTNDDPRRARLTIAHVLTMRTGVDYHERGANSPHDRLNRLSHGWDRFYIERPMTSEPGLVFNYDSGGVIFLSALLKQATGMHADEFAAATLFPTLGITNWRWLKNNEGHPHTGGGLSLRLRDMAKLGQLYLYEGRWNGKQVIPEGWVAESLTMHVPLDGVLSPPFAGYGYLWWLLEPDPAGNGEEYIYAAWGWRGQYIFVVPEHNLVVAINGNAVGREAERGLIAMLYDHILPALVSR